MCITKNRYKFSYGRKPKGQRLSDITIPNLNEIPSWVYEIKIPEDINNFNIDEISEELRPIFQIDIKELKKIIKYQNYPKFNELVRTIVNIEEPKEKTPELNIQEWGKFCLKDLFEIHSGIYIPKKEKIKGFTPFIGATNKNNGITEFINKKPIFKGNSLTIASRGNDAITFYQEKDFIASNSVTVLIPKYKFNKYIAMFIKTIIQKEKFRYNYGRIMSMAKVKDTVIKLPTKPDGTPDWEFMENYIKTLKYSNYI